MFKAFIFIYHFLDFYKEQEKMGRSTISFVTNFLFISPFAFTFQRSFCEKSLLKTTLRHHYSVWIIIRHVLLCVYREEFLVKYQIKIG